MSEGEDEVGDLMGVSDFGGSSSSEEIRPVITGFVPYHGHYEEEVPDKYTVEDPRRDDPEFVGPPEEDQDSLGVGYILAPLVISAAELEFLLVACARGNQTLTPPFRDPHPKDKRWLSKKLTRYDYAPQRGQTTHHESVSRNYVDAKAMRRLKQVCMRRLTRILNHDGLYAQLSTDATDLGELDCSESDISDEEGDEKKERRKKTIRTIANFSFEAPFDSRRLDISHSTQAGTFFDAFTHHCEVNHIDIRALTPEDIRLAQGRIHWCLRHWPTFLRVQVAGWFGHKLRELRSVKKGIDDTALGEVQDPNHVQVVGLAKKYRAWTVVEDTSVDGAGMARWRYEIPDGFEIRFFHPMTDYRWFGAEVVSPVLPANNEITFETIRKACSSLRNRLRIHKPMEVSSGLHVHLGHKHGWNLLHIKRFVTLWAAVEETLIYLHRKDRGAERMRAWCGPLAEVTRLACYHTAQTEGERRMCADFLPRTAPETEKRNKRIMAEHIPMEHLHPDEAEFFTDVWKYTTLDELCSALHGISYYRPTARIRISGEKVSAESKEFIPQTIEIRTMHGTLDADHINHWIIVLQRIIYYVRRASTASYQNLIRGIMTQILADQNVRLLLELLGVPKETIDYFFHPSHRGEDENGKSWWVYPDNDRVNWGDPFMAPGHGSTHGPQWDTVLGQHWKQTAAPKTATPATGRARPKLINKDKKRDPRNEGDTAATGNAQWWGDRGYDGADD
ncbi:hypothetical protein AAE478_001966 [Parahypoxylon ruwenzoriense]